MLVQGLNIHSELPESPKAQLEALSDWKYGWALAGLEK